MRRTDFAKRKCAIHHRFQPSCEHVPEDFVQFTHGPHVRTQNPQLPREQMPQVDPNNTGKAAPRDVFAYVIHEGKVRAPAAAMELIERLKT